MLEALRNDPVDPDAREEVLDEVHARREVGSRLIGEAVFSLIEIRKALARLLAALK